MSWKRPLKFFIAFCGFISGLFLFLSIGVTSSDFKPLMSKDGVNLCYNGQTIAAGRLRPNAQTGKVKCYLQWTVTRLIGT